MDEKGHELSRPADRTGQSDLKSQRAYRRRVGAGVGLLVLLLAALTAGSWAAWTVTDANSGNTFSTNTILLSDNQGGEGGSASNVGTAMINITNLEPGSTFQGCMQVDITGSATTNTLALSATPAGSAALEGALIMSVAQYNTTGADTVTAGSDTNHGSCAGYPGAGLNTNVGSPGPAETMTAWVASLGGSYNIASPVTQTWYEFSGSLPAADSGNCSTLCGQSVTLALTWTLTTT